MGSWNGAVRYGRTKESQFHDGACCTTVIILLGQLGGKGMCWQVGLMASPLIPPWPALLSGFC